MMNLMELFMLKMMDTIISSGKTLFMIRNKKFLSALSQAIANIFNIVLMSKLLKSTDALSILTTSLAMFIGQFLSQWIAERFDKDKIWKIQVTPITKEQGKTIADELKENNIALQTYPCFRNGIKVLGLNIFAETKAQSAVVENVLSQHNCVKYNITQIKNRF